VTETSEPPPCPECLRSVRHIFANGSRLPKAEHRAAIGAFADHLLKEHAEGRTAA
jgi:hypothetical protein